MVYGMVFLFTYITLHLSVNFEFYIISLMMIKHFFKHLSFTVKLKHVIEQ